MKVAIDARMPDGQYGGVQQTVFGLASGLSRLETSHRYVFLVGPDHSWLEPAVAGPCSLLQVTHRNGSGHRSWHVRWPTLAKIATRFRSLYEDEVGLAGLLRRQGVDVVHLMWQRGFRTSLPTLWQPHDLQHVHHPDFFDLPTRAYRHLHYRRMARRATHVGVMTIHGAEDVVRHLGVARERIVVVPWAPVIGSQDADSPNFPLPDGVPTRYLLFPGKTWPHKNHIGLVRALGLLRQRGLEVPVVLTGGETSHWSAIAAAMREVGVEDLVHPLGFVPSEQLVTLYRRTWAVLFPSLYEGWGLPAVEAMQLGAPLLCSAIEPLLELTAGAAVTFDPASPESMAAAIRGLWEDPAERDRWAAAARARSSDLSWDATAQVFEAIYEHMAALPLSEEKKRRLAAALLDGEATAAAPS